jgi:hypothetical protein
MIFSQINLESFREGVLFEPLSRSKLVCIDRRHFKVACGFVAYV